MIWIPSLLSGSRIIIAFLLLFVFPTQDERVFVFGLVLISIAFLTDILDGKLARRLGIASETGYVLDGLGDRSIYLALILIGMLNGHIGIAFAWLLIFREIGIYALRVLDKTCRPRGLLRTISLIHATAIRLWILGMLIGDGAQLFFSYELITVAWFIAIQTGFLSITIVVSYIGLSIQSYKLFDT